VLTHIWNPDLKKKKDMDTNGGLFVGVAVEGGGGREGEEGTR
jgi:hypothetical protein